MIFVDSNVFISLWDKDNVNHHKAREKSKRLDVAGGKIVISNIVVYEVATILAMRVSKLKALDFLGFVDSGRVDVIFVDEEVSKRALKIFIGIKDKNVGFFDCTSFAIIEKYGIGEVFSFDKDFAKYGKNLDWKFV